MSHISPKDQILSEGFESVIDSGVRSFTVEALSQRLAMSKKTIYKFFPTKDNLIHAILKFAMNRVESIFESVMANEPNPAVQFIKIMEKISKIMGKTSVHRLVELKSQYPMIWREIEQFRLSRVDKFYDILIKGQEEGLVRNEIDVKMTVIIYINIVNTTFQPEFFIKYDLSVNNTIQGFVDIVARGIFTEKGMKAIEKYYER